MKKYLHPQHNCYKSFLNGFWYRWTWLDMFQRCTKIRKLLKIGSQHKVFADILLKLIMRVGLVLLLYIKYTFMLLYSFYFFQVNAEVQWCPMRHSTALTDQKKGKLRKIQYSGYQYIWSLVLYKSIFVNLWMCVCVCVCVRFAFNNCLGPG